MLSDGEYTFDQIASNYNGGSADAVVYVGKAITLRAVNFGRAIINAEGRSRVMEIQSMQGYNMPVTLEGLHLTNGFWDDWDMMGKGGGCLYIQGGAVRLRSVSFSNCNSLTSSCAISYRVDPQNHDPVNSELYNISYLPSDASRKHCQTDGCTSDCATGMMVSIPFPIPNRCVNLGEWEPPNPSAARTGVWTGCRYKCDAGTYGDSYDLGEGTCTASCPPGHQCPQGSGAPIPCPQDTYASGSGSSSCTTCPAFSTTTSTTGATSIEECGCVQGFYKAVNDAGSTVCSACPEGSTTSAAGSTSVDQCVCQQGRYFNIDAEGVATCPTCPEGSTMSAAGSTSVDQCICQQGRFLSIDADGATCPQCKDELEGSTSLVAGATSVEACVCTQNYFLKANETSRTCVACDPALMDCSIPGITLANMPIKRGGWRLSNTTSTVYECFNPDACVGNPVVVGSNATQRRRLSAGASTSTAGNTLCAPGHTGFLCGACVADWCVAPHASHAPPFVTSFVHEVAWFTSHITHAEVSL